MDLLQFEDLGDLELDYIIDGKLFDDRVVPLDADFLDLNLLFDSMIAEPFLTSPSSDGTRTSLGSLSPVHVAGVESPTEARPGNHS